MKHFHLIFFLLFSQPFFAQENAVADIRTFIEAGRLAEAENLVNRYLQDDPINVDLLMMKGNVELNKYIVAQQVQLSLVPSFNESIYEMGTLEGRPTPVTVPVEVADKVTYLWKGAATLDPSRNDLHLGLCQVYAISGQREKLLAYLPVAKQKTTGLENLHADLASYATNLRERGDPVGAKAVWRKVIELFPEQPGLVSDLAGEYFFEGNLDSARHYIGQAMALPGATENMLGNAFFLSALMGDYDRALAAIQRLPGNGHLLYEGVLRFFRKEKKWEKPLEKLLESNPGPSELAVAQLFLGKNFQPDMDTYLTLLGHDLGDPVKVLIHQIFQQPGAFLPSFNAAETYTYHRRYGAAAAGFRQMEKDGPPLETADLENFLFYSAWAFQQLGERETADAKWRQLLGSENFYKKSAAHWFVGKRLFDQGKKLEARDVFKEMAAFASESKFATFCWTYMGVE